MNSEQVNLDPDKYHASMVNHPKPGPALKIVYHPQEAPAGMQYLMEEALNMLKKPGWVDSPAKYPGANNNNESDDAAKERVVDAAVKKELEGRKDNKPGVYPQSIPQDMLPDFTTCSPDHLEDFIKHFQLHPGLDLTKDRKALVKQVKTLVTKHNKTFE